LMYNCKTPSLAHVSVTQTSCIYIHMYSAMPGLDAIKPEPEHSAD